MSTTYIPGVCNIGPAEIKTRKLSGIIGLYATVILFAILMITGVDSPWRLFLFIPATIGAMGYLQARFHFCVRFGTRGLFNMGTTLVAPETVEKAEYRRKDQRKALSIAGLSIGIGIVVTLIVFLLP
ncbi:hypothetical protein EPN95_00010 [Patescibacteria group bacterium]|nr:MAG: hypothetical protein EPN95_00010 [Patescibacteria group bacterium]